MRNYLINNFIIYSMMDDNHTPSSVHSESKANKKKGSFAIMITMILIGAIILIAISYQYLVATQTDAPIMEVEVDVKETGGKIHIVEISTTQSRMDLLESPRIDDKGIIPGVRIKLFSGQKVLSYDRFVGYSGSGSYRLICGFKENPEEGDLMTCTAWVFSEDGASFADDQESTEVVWGDARSEFQLVTKVTIEGKLTDTGADANITQVQVSSSTDAKTLENQGCYFPGIFAHAKRFSSQVSYTACADYEGGGNYTLFITLIEKPNTGDEFTVTVSVWHRNGQWLEGFYEPPRDSFSTTIVWG
jgi:hypothetical protein